MSSTGEVNVNEIGPDVSDVDPKLGPLQLSGFKPLMFTPPTSLFEIVGTDCQLVEIQVPAAGVVLSEPGTLCHMDPGFSLTVSTNGCGNAFKRCCCAGESCFRVYYTNNTNGSISLGLTPNFPAKVIPIDMEKYSGVTIKSGSFIGAISSDVEVRLRYSGSVRYTF